MPKLSIDNARKPGRPVVNSTPYTVRIPPALDAKIDALLVIYNAVVAKVPGEHAQAAIFASVVAEK